ncbi:MAG: hypothetical protein IJ730_04860 [Alphaproteobacteria bacterium]|nr:hypothetical protein [Alphaproteobacteria bacterium]
MNELAQIEGASSSSSLEAHNSTPAYYPAIELKGCLPFLADNGSQLEALISELENAQDKLKKIEEDLADLNTKIEKLNFPTSQEGTKSSKRGKRQTVQSKNDAILKNQKTKKEQEKNELQSNIATLNENIRNIGNATEELFSANSTDIFQKMFINNFAASISTLSDVTKKDRFEKEVKMIEEHEKLIEEHEKLIEEKKELNERIKTLEKKNLELTNAPSFWTRINPLYYLRRNNNTANKNEEIQNILPEPTEQNIQQKPNEVLFDPFKAITDEDMKNAFFAGFCALSSEVTSKATTQSFLNSLNLKIGKQFYYKDVISHIYNIIGVTLYDEAFINLPDFNARVNTVSKNLNNDTRWESIEKPYKDKAEEKKNKNTAIELLNNNGLNEIVPADFSFYPNDIQAIMLVKAITNKILQRGNEAVNQLHKERKEDNARLEQIVEDNTQMTMSEVQNIKGNLKQLEIQHKQDREDIKKDVNSLLAGMGTSNRLSLAQIDIKKKLLENNTISYTSANDDKDDKDLHFKHNEDEEVGHFNFGNVFHIKGAFKNNFAYLNLENAVFLYYSMKIRSTQDGYLAMQNMIGYLDSSTEGDSIKVIVKKNNEEINYIFRNNSKIQEVNKHGTFNVVPLTRIDSESTTIENPQIEDNASLARIDSNVSNSANSVD